MKLLETSLNHESTACDKTAIIRCRSLSSAGNSKLYLININDCVFENVVMVRMKRKHGKHKREVVLVDYNSR